MNDTLEKPRLLLPNGRPVPDEMLMRRETVTGEIVEEAATPGEIALKTLVSYTSALNGITLPAIQRAADPYRNHPWVFAAALAAALNASQVHYTVWKETQDKIDARLKSGDRPRRGKKRRAVQRYLRQPSRRHGYRIRGLEEDLNHQMTDVFEHPNPVSLCSSALWMLTNVWFFIRGEAFWLLLDESGDPCTYDSGKIAEIWVISPDLMHERLIGNQMFGWWMSTGVGTGLQLNKARVDLAIEEVIHFKISDPGYPIRGMSPLTALAAGINLDMLAVRHNTGVMQNGAEPGGVLVHEGPGAPFKNTTEKDEFRDKWEQRHRGAGNDRKIALLTGGWKYVPVGMSPKDMDFLKGRQWTREEILGTMGVPKSVLAITDHVNFATQLAQDRNFWEKKLIPTLEIYEQTLDATIFQQEPDTTVAGFDLSKVEALKVGLSDKVKVAMDLTASNLHMPPDVAFETVGLDVPDYEASDQSVVPQGTMSLEAALAQADLLKKQAENPQDESLYPKPPAPPPGAAKPFGGGGGSDTSQGPSEPRSPAQDPNRSPTTEPKSPPAAEKAPAAKIIKASGGGRWRRLIARVQAPFEMRMRRVWRDYARKQKAAQLRRLDARMKALGYVRRGWQIKAGELDDPEGPLGAILDLSELSDELRDAFKSVYEDELAAVAEATVEDVGGDVTAADLLDTDAVQAALDDRLDILTESAPGTLREEMLDAVKEGLQAEETVQEIRDRVAEVLDIAGGEAKALMIARTESAGLMNDAREAMFDAQGFDKREWVDAGDEHVRGDHARLGQVGPVDAGHNYMEDLGKSGVLRYPGDPKAPAGQVINCRCVHVPA